MTSELRGEKLVGDSQSLDLPQVSECESSVLRSEQPTYGGKVLHDGELSDQQWSLCQ